MLAAASELIQHAARVVALTGAGISCPSGIPDFRSADGLYGGTASARPASLSDFRAAPERWYAQFRPLVQRLVLAEPNPAHRALAQLERDGELAATITQNIDGLHQRAGGRAVFELHGNLRGATCLECGYQMPAAPLLARIVRGEIPRCRCGGLLKPDVVLFDDELPRTLYWLAEREIQRCDLLLICGTSLQVAPANLLPQLARRVGAQIIVIDTAPTPCDAHASLVIRQDLAGALPAIAELVARRQPQHQGVSPWIE